MATVLLFHHAQGLTDGVRWFADELRDAGHQVTVPDLYDGATFSSLDDGVAHAEVIALDEITARGVAAAADLPAGAVVAGFSLGALPAQKIAQIRPGMRGAILFHGGVPSSQFGGPWRAEVALQLHVGAEDEWSELDVAETLASEAADGTLYLYPGPGHLLADNSLPEFEPDSAALILSRTKQFLNRVR